MHADVVVVGLGTMGSAAAWRLAEAGVRVVGLDRFRPPHARGAHGGDSRIIRIAYMEGADYVPLVRRSYELWREIERASGESLLSVTGGLMLGTPDSLAVAGARRTALVHGLAHEMLDAAQVRRRFPAFTPADDEVGLYEEVAGLLRPEACVAATLRLARRAGARIDLDVTVSSWQAGRDGVSVTTAGGQTWHCDRLVLAPGAWASGLTRLAVPLRVQRRVQFLFTPPRTPRFDPGNFPVWIWSYAPGLAAYGLPEVDGRVKAAFHNGDDPADPDVGAAPAQPYEEQGLREWLAGRVPALAAAPIVSTKPCLYTLTPDEHFVLGLHPRSPRVAVACGFSGHGFKFAPVVGEVLAELVTTGTSHLPIGLFAPDRFGSAPGSGPDEFVHSDQMVPPPQ